MKPIKLRNYVCDMNRLPAYYMNLISYKFVRYLFFKIGLWYPHRFFEHKGHYYDLLYGSETNNNNGFINFHEITKPIRNKNSIGGYDYSFINNFCCTTLDEDTDHDEIYQIIKNQFKG